MKLHREPTLEEIEGYYLYQWLKNMYENLGIDSFYFDLNETNS